MRMPIAVISSIIFILSANGWAFDVDGFRSEMSRKEIENIITKWNFDKIDNKEDTILAYDKPNNKSNRFYIFTFDKGKLINIQKDYKPNMKNFIMLFDKLSKDYGKPTSSGSGSDISTTGETKYITFNWVNQRDSIELAYYVFEDNDQLCVRHANNASH